jgi:hypothetical protein
LVHQVIYQLTLPVYFFRVVTVVAYAGQVDQYRMHAYRSIIYINISYCNNQTCNQYRSND